MLGRRFNQPAAILAVAVSMCLSTTAARAADPVPSSTAELAAQVREQQLQIERQRQELERQRAALDQQQQKLESLAAALDAQRAATAAPVAASATSEPTAAGPEATVPAAAQPAAESLTARAAAGSGLHFAGYTDMNYQRYDFYENAQSTVSKAQAKTDMARFVLAPHYDFGHGWSFFGELEVEHGGTGASIDYEAEETGEFESEIEHGGEVALEQLYLQYSYSPALNFRIGELVVPVGMVNTYHQPTEYFTVERSLGETTLIPNVWHESGIQALGTIGRLRYQLQVVTALDSTGFSGHDFVVGGMQNRFEWKYANGFAFVGQAEYSLAPGVLVGGAFYTGDSEPNRPRRNLGHKANVTLAEVHGRYEVGSLTFRGQYLQGWVQNSAFITAANLNTFNGGVLGTSRTAVGKQARSWYAEAGYDLLPLFGRREWGRLDLFARYEAYDTNADTAATIARVARYDRKAATVGVNYKPRPGIVVKGEFSHRTNDADIANKQNLFGLGAGFEF